VHYNEAKRKKTTVTCDIGLQHNNINKQQSILIIILDHSIYVYFSQVQDCVTVRVTDDTAARDS